MLQQSTLGYDLQQHGSNLSCVTQITMKKSCLLHYSPPFLTIPHHSPPSLLFLTFTMVIQPFPTINLSSIVISLIIAPCCWPFPPPLHHVHVSLISTIPSFFKVVFSYLRSHQTWHAIFQFWTSTSYSTHSIIHVWPLPPLQPRF